VSWVEANQIDVHQGGIGMARAQALAMEQSGAGAVFTDEAHVARSGVGVLVAGQAELSQTRTVVLLAREVHGEVQTVLDTRGAALAGIAAGVVVGLLLMIGGLLGRRKA